LYVLCELNAHAGVVSGGKTKPYDQQQENGGTIEIVHG